MRNLKTKVTQHFDFYICPSQNVVKRSASSCHVANAFLTRLKFGPYPAWKSPKCSENVFLAKSSKSQDQWDNLYLYKLKWPENRTRICLKVHMPLDTATRLASSLFILTEWKTVTDSSVLIALPLKRENQKFQVTIWNYM